MEKELVLSDGKEFLGSRVIRLMSLFVLLVGSSVYEVKAQGPYTADNDRSFSWPSSDLPSDVCLSGNCGSICTSTSENWRRREFFYSPTSVSVGNTVVTSRNSTVRRADRSYGSPAPGSPTCVVINETGNTVHNSNFSTVNFVDFESSDLTHTLCADASVNLQSTLSYTSGVTWSGTGVNSSGVFTHTTPGTYNPVATRVFNNGTSTFTFTVTVNAFPVLTFSAIPAFCQSVTSFDLHTYTAPDVGTFSSPSGAVFNGHFFNPSTAGVGTHTINWSHTVGGCTSNASRTVTVDGTITVDAGANQAACDGSGDITLTATTSGVSWSCVTAGCTYVTGGIFDTNAAPPGTYTVRASKSNGTCSAIDDKTFTVNSLPVVNAGPDLVFCIDDGIQTLTGASPTLGSWSASCGACVSGSTLNLTLAGEGSHTITYTAMDANSCINSDTRSLTINPLPDETAVVVNSPERCGSGPVTFNASLTGTNTFNWFADATGGTTLHTGASYSPNLTNTTTFYIEVTSSVTCVSANRKAAVGIVHPVPVPPIAPATPRCGSGPITLNASGGIANATYRWYENATGGVPLDTGPSFSTTVTSTRSFYVDALSDENCVSPSRTEVVVTVNPVPGVPTTFPNAICGAGIVPLSVGGTPAGGDYRWYPMESGGASFENSNTFNADITQTTSYWVSIVTAENCEGPRQEIVATINTPPVAPVGTPDDRCGSGPVSISASGAGVTFDWYATEFSSVSLFTGQNYQPTIAVTTSFWVETTDINNCTSLRTKVDAVVFDIPVDPTVPAVNRCGPGQIDIPASGSGVGAFYDWFDNPTGGSSLFTGDTFQPTVVTTRSYYVSATSADDCPSPGRTQVLVTVNAIPSQPLVNHNSSCGAGPVDLTVGGAPAGGDYRWYPTETGGVSFESSNSFNPNLSITTSYWVSIVTAENCEGPRAEIIGSVLNVPDPPTGTGSFRCGTGQLTITANSAVAGLFNWYETAFSQVSLFQGASYLTPNISETTSYWVDITDGNNCISTRTQVFAIVHPIAPDPTASNESSCGAGPVSLTASGGGASAVYSWYENATGGSPVFIGVTYQPFVSLTKNYYVSATSDQNCVSVNRTEVTVTINPIPSVPTTSPGSNCGAGIAPLAVGGAPVGGDYRWYPTETGGISFNSDATYDADISETTSYWVSIVTGENCEGPRAEIVAIINDAPSAPTGIPNNRCGTGIIILSASSGQAGSFNWYATEFDQTILFSGVNYATPVISVTTVYWVEFVDGNGCISPRTMVEAKVNPIPVDAVVVDVNRCGPGPIDIVASGSGVGAVYNWYENSAGGSPIFTGDIYQPTLSLSRNYYVSATSIDNCISVNRTEVTVTINPFPSQPSVTNGNVCGSGPITLSAGGAPVNGDYNWYETDNSSEVIATGNQFTTPVLVNTRSYFVSIVNQFDCEGQRSEVVAEVNLFPGRPTGEDEERCGSGDVTLTVSTPVVNPTINWYFADQGGTAFANGLLVTISDLTETTIYYASVVTPEGCESTREAVTATINPIIPVDIGPNIILCLNAGTYDLSQDLPQGITIADGFFLGAGVIGTDFHPSIANLGNKEITFLLQTEIGCMTNGTRFITVIDVKENGEELSFSNEEINQCITDGLIDLTGLPNFENGTWSIDAAEGSINVGIVDPVAAGIGEWTATYSVDVNGCTVTRTIPINILGSPASPVVEGDNLICVGELIELEASGGSVGTTYHWFENDDQVSFAIGETVEIDPEESTVYRVQAQNAFSCFSQPVEFSIDVINVVLDFTAIPTTINVGDRVEFSTEVAAESYNWDFGDDLSSRKQNPVHIYFDEGSFDVLLEVVTVDGCELSKLVEDMILVENDNVITGIEDDINLSIESTVYPQPFNSGFTLKIESLTNQDATVYIYGFNGNMILKREVSLTNGLNELYFHETELSFVDGGYLLKLVDENNRSHNHRLIKRK